MTSAQTRSAFEPGTPVVVGTTTDELDLVVGPDPAGDRPSDPVDPGLVRRRVRAVVRTTIVLGAPVVIAALVSLVVALGRSGNLSMDERFVEWLRDHHAGSLVNRVEHYYYSRHQPALGGALLRLPSLSEPTTVEPGTTAVTTTSVPQPGDRPAAVVPFVPAPLPDEGVWKPLGDSVNGRPAMYATLLRPDELHTSLVVAAVHIDQRLARFALYAGRIVPGHGPWPGNYSISRPAQRHVLAAFNSGFRIPDSAGGFFLGGRHMGVLRDGAASAVIHTDGTMTIDQWGRDSQAGPDVVAVRQNLALIVDDGRLVPGVGNSDDSRWGKTVGNALFVWRSGIGMDASGNLLYVAGPGLSVKTLAAVLQRAGAVRAMELDINYAWVQFNVFPHDERGRLDPRRAFKLLDGMKKPPTRYLTTEDRDFFAVFART